MSNTNKKIIL